MTLEQFAKSAGMKLKQCDAEWGGTIAYVSEDGLTICGFRTESAAYNHWLRESVGPKTARAIKRLLKQTEGAKP